MEPMLMRGTATGERFYYSASLGVSLEPPDYATRVAVLKWAWLPSLEVSFCQVFNCEERCSRPSLDIKNYYLPDVFPGV